MDAACDDITPPLHRRTLPSFNHLARLLWLRPCGNTMRNLWACKLLQYNKAPGGEQVARGDGLLCMSNPTLAMLGSATFPSLPATRTVCYWC